MGDVELVKLFLKKDTSLAHMTEEKGILPFTFQLIKDMLM
ncbi:hypothetical protein CFP56_023874 [Quercus suber]|uniref:Uncharacterized protein n=1 Tax=Quercus suber TaxID=58331 RepID=A0AAW0K987_QUESU